MSMRGNANYHLSWGTRPSENLSEIHWQLLEQSYLLCINVIHNTAQNSSVDPYYLLDNPHSSDDVYWRGGKLRDTEMNKELLGRDKPAYLRCHKSTYRRWSSWLRGRWEVERCTWLSSSYSCRPQRQGTSTQWQAHSRAGLHRCCTCIVECPQRTAILTSTTINT